MLYHKPVTYRPAKTFYAVDARSTNSVYKVIIPFGIACTICEREGENVIFKVEGWTLKYRIHTNVAKSVWPNFKG